MAALTGAGLSSGMNGTSMRNKPFGSYEVASDGPISGRVNGGRDARTSVSCVTLSIGRGSVVVGSTVGSAVAVPVAGGGVLVDCRSAVGGPVIEGCFILEGAASMVGLLTASVAGLTTVTVIGSGCVVAVGAAVSAFPPEHAASSRPQAMMRWCRPLVIFHESHNTSYIIAAAFTGALLDPSHKLPPALA